MSLKGKKALVTGSTSGIGEGIAERLANSGCDVVLHGFGDADAIETLRFSLEKKYNVIVTFVGGDLSKPEGVDEMLKGAGDVDILVNNAGIQHVAKVQDFPYDRWSAVLAINLTAAFLTTKACIPHMYQKKWGRIINIASAHGRVASPNKSAYVAAKHGLIGLTKSVALEAAEETATNGSLVTCNAVCPGWVMTPLVKKQIEDRATQSNKTFAEEMVLLCGEKHPTQKFTTTTQLGDTVVFLCSSAADNMTGTELTLDGGWVAR